MLALFAAQQTATVFRESFALVVVRGSFHNSESGLVDTRMRPELVTGSTVIGSRKVQRPAPRKCSAGWLRGVRGGPPRIGPYGLLVLGSASALGVLEAVALAGEFEDLTAVSEPIEGGAGEAFGAEDLGPVLEGQVGGDDQAVPFVGLTDQVEQELGARSARRDVSQLVEHQQVLLAELGAQAQEGLLIACFLEAVPSSALTKKPLRFPLRTGHPRKEQPQRA